MYNFQEYGMDYNYVPFRDAPDSADIHAGHPFKNSKTHEKLLSFLRQRLMIGKLERDRRLPRMVRVDKSYAGWLRHSREDLERDRKQEEEGIPQGIKQHLPLTWVQLDDMMTYFAQVFAPSKGMFYSQGDPKEQTVGHGIASIMNNDSIYTGAYRDILQCILSILKYNLGGLTADWDQEIGPGVTGAQEGSQYAAEQVVWRGNRFHAIDMYNAFYDPTTHPTEIHKCGEFFAEATIVPKFWIMREAQRERIFNVRKILESNASNTGLGEESEFYRFPPSEAHLSVDQSVGTSQTNWVSVLSQTPGTHRQSGYEKIDMWCYLNPYEMNLIPRNSVNKSSRNKLELWRFTIISGKYIVRIEPMRTIHGFIPAFMGLINDDVMGPSAKSPAEILKPLQDFASFNMNTHIEATRKNIWGLIVYDPSIVDLNAIPKGEVAARIPLKASGWGRNIQEGIWEHNNRLETTQTIENLQGILEMINLFFPASSMPNQVANLERAVDSQVAAVVQGSTRRMQKAAMLIDHTVFRPLRFAAYWNIVAFHDANVEITDFRGKQVKVNLAELKETDLPFILGQGLKSIDIQAAAAKLQMIIFAIIQNPQIASTIDLLGLIDYWTSMMDVDVDMKQFRLQQTPQGAGAVIASGDPAAGAAADAAAGGEPVPASPITDPMAVTGPLYG